MSADFRFTDGRLAAVPAHYVQEYMTRPGLTWEVERLAYHARVDTAYAVMLTEQNVLSREQGRALVTALAEMATIPPAEFPVDPQRGSLWFQIEAWLATKVGPETAGRLHTGRGRADYGAAVLTLYAGDAVLRTMEAILDFQEILLATADDHAETLMPGYTHLQQSQPTTYGHYLLSHAFPFQRDLDRLQQLYARNHLCPLGSPARSGTSWPIDRRRLARLLGYLDISPSTQDLPYYRREHMADVAAVFSLLLSNLGRLATDLEQWMSEEFGYLEISDEFAGSSSVMPQKKNPEPLEMVRGLAGESIGWMPAMLGLLKAAHTSSADPEYTPLHNGGLIRQVALQAVQALEITGGILRTLRVHTDVMAARVGRGWSASSHLADVLAREGNVPFQAAHAVVGRLVRLALQRGVEPAQASAALLQQAASEIGVAVPAMGTEAIRRHLDPMEFIRTRTTEGSQHPDETRRVLGIVTESLRPVREWLGGRRQAQAVSDAELRQAARAILAA